MRHWNLIQDKFPRASHFNMLRSAKINHLVLYVFVGIEGKYHFLGALGFVGSFSVLSEEGGVDPRFFGTVFFDSLWTLSLGSFMQIAVRE